MRGNMMPHEILEKVLYRDALMLVIDKPAGIPVHHGRGGGLNMEQFFPLLRYGLPKNPSLAHRLDKDTSGCLILGRHRKALDMLGKLFQQNKIKKTYWAIVEGEPPQDEGVIDFPIGKKSDKSYEWQMMVGGINPQPAITNYKVLGKKDGKTWLELKPQTGRTHQLRVHLSASNCPILGDKIYGNADRANNDPMFLHAESLEIPLYKNKDAIIVHSPAPAWFGEFVN